MEENIFFGIILPLEERGDTFVLNASLFAKQIELLIRVTKIQATQGGLNPRIYFSYMLDLILSCAPENLHRRIEQNLFPAINESWADTGRLSEHHQAIFHHYAAALAEELKKHVIKPNFEKVPKQTGFSKPFYMAQPENFHVSKMEDAVCIVTEMDVSPAKEWHEQIRKANGWRAIRDLIRHAGGKVKIVKPDAAILSRQNNTTSQPIARTHKFIRDRGLLLDQTAYMAKIDDVSGVHEKTAVGARLGMALQNNFAVEMAGEGYAIQPTQYGIQWGDFIYDEVRDVIFVGKSIKDVDQEALTMMSTTLLTENAAKMLEAIEERENNLKNVMYDYIELATRQLCLRVVTGKTRVVAVPLIDPGIQPVNFVLRQGGAYERRSLGRERFYHLDTMMFASNGKIAIYPEATIPSVIKEIGADVDNGSYLWWPNGDKALSYRH